MLEPAILLSLLGEQVHGYELIEQVQGLVGDEVCVDSGSTYRMLRSMEAEGRVVSTWVITEQGPNRRTYAITPAGRASLVGLIAELRRRASKLETLAEEAEDRLTRFRHAPQPAAGEHDHQGVPRCPE